MGRVKLDKEDVEMIKLLCKFTTYFDREIAEMYGVTRGHITKIRNKKRWNYDYGEETEKAAKKTITRGISFHGKRK